MNDVKLQEGTHPVDENLRPIKVGGKSTALETAQHGDGVRVNGDLEVVNGDVKLTTDDSGDITLDAIGGDVNILQADVKMPTLKKLYLDGGGDTYIYEASADSVRHVVGDDVVMILSEAGNDGNMVNFGTSAAGFTSFAPTYGSNTYVYFNRFGLKAELIFDGGNITNLRLVFPDVSCNCVLIIKQDGTGSRTITNYETYDQSAGNPDTLYFPNGGTSPTLTTTGNGIDILSIYWDNSRHKAYGVMSLDFEASS